MTSLASRIADARKKAEKATPGPWYPGHFADDTHPCNCKHILSECYMGNIAEISVGNGLPISEGGNDAPLPEEAKANMRYIAATSPSLFIEMADEIDRLTAQLEKARAALEPFATHAQTALSSVADNREITLVYSEYANDGVGHVTAGDLRTAARVHAELTGGKAPSN